MNFSMIFIYLHISGFEPFWIDFNRFCSVLAQFPSSWFIFRPFCSFSASFSLFQCCFIHALSEIFSWSSSFNLLPCLLTDQFNFSEPKSGSLDFTNALVPHGTRQGEGREGEREGKKKERRRIECIIGCEKKKL